MTRPCSPVAETKHNSRPKTRWAHLRSEPFRSVSGPQSPGQEDTREQAVPLKQSPVSSSSYSHLTTLSSSHCVHDLKMQIAFFTLVMTNETLSVWHCVDLIFIFPLFLFYVMLSGPCGTCWVRAVISGLESPSQDRYVAVCQSVLPLLIKTWRHLIWCSNRHSSGLQPDFIILFFIVLMWWAR